MSKVNWVIDDEIKNRVRYLLEIIDAPWIKLNQVHCVRSTGTNTRAYARIWGLPNLWQMVLNIKANYIIEVISEKFDKLSQEKKDKVLIHELSHIPKNFSGALLPHNHKGESSFHSKLKIWERMYDNYVK